jgi:hypothetical protein
VKYPPLPPQRNREAGRCNDHCPEGHACTLRADVPHKMHICSNPACACHSAARYQPNADNTPDDRPKQNHPPVMAKARHK